MEEITQTPLQNYWINLHAVFAKNSELSQGSSGIPTRRVLNGPSSWIMSFTKFYYILIFARNGASRSRVRRRTLDSR